MDERIKGSILEQEPPPVSDFVNRVRFCAKALAYGAANDLWEPSIVVTYGRWSQSSGEDGYSQRFNEYFNSTSDKNMGQLDYYPWEGSYPKISHLEALMYVRHTNTRRMSESTEKVIIANDWDIYLLTQKAFELLETPLTTPKAFISYRRGVSTVLGLLVEARLKALSNDLNPFIDKDLKLGKPWREQLQQRIRNCDTFISLLGSEKSFSENVMAEIRWAKEANKDVISIWHGDFKEISPNVCPDRKLAEFFRR